MMSDTNFSQTESFTNDVLNQSQTKQTMLMYIVFGLAVVLLLMCVMAVVCKIVKMKQNRQRRPKPKPRPKRVDPITSDKWEQINGSETNRSRKRSLDMRNHQQTETTT